MQVQIRLLSVVVLWMVTCLVHVGLQALMHDVQRAAERLDVQALHDLLSGLRPTGANSSSPAGGSRDQRHSTHVCYMSQHMQHLSAAFCMGNAATPSI